MNSDPFVDELYRVCKAAGVNSDYVFQRLNGVRIRKMECFGRFWLVGGFAGG